MELHDEHVIAYSIEKLKQMFGGKTPYEHKQDSLFRQSKAEKEFWDTEPTVGERVHFRSKSVVNDSVFEGYGEVLSIIVKDYFTHYALYRIKADHGMNYEAYLNDPNDVEPKEFIKHAEK
ncbi:hypothetical protein ENKO_400 [Klebsiella phage fENko-Kae01]|nr:hypothetical protein [Klebsiella phage fENko-Kae01]